MMGPGSATLEQLQDSVHVWVRDVSLAPDDLSSFERDLSVDERQRAHRFRFPRDRRTYVVAHWLVRRILGRYLNVAPDGLQFDVNPYGKPTLPNHQGLRFNLSHSGELVVVAVTKSREVGVDVERIRPDFATSEIARHFFAPTEVAALDRLNGMDFVHAFFACWTRKEAYVKAVGLGLSLELDTFAVSIAPAGPARLLSAEGGPCEVARWGLHALELSPGYAAALAVEGPEVAPAIFCGSFADLA